MAKQVKGTFLTNDRRQINLFKRRSCELQGKEKKKKKDFVSQLLPVYPTVPSPFTLLLPKPAPSKVVF